MTSLAPSSSAGITCRQLASHTCIQSFRRSASWARRHPHGRADVLGGCNNALSAAAPHVVHPAAAGHLVIQNTRRPPDFIAII
jgi:hypothetical protein